MTKFITLLAAFLSAAAVHSVRPALRFIRLEGYVTDSTRF